MEGLGSRVHQERKVTKDLLVQLVLLERQGSLESMVRRVLKDQLAPMVKMEIRETEVIQVAWAKLDMR